MLLTLIFSAVCHILPESKDMENMTLVKPESLLLTSADAAYHSLKVCFTAGARRRAGNRRMRHLLPGVSPSPSQHMILPWTMLADDMCSV